MKPLFQTLLITFLSTMLLQADEQWLQKKITVTLDNVPVEKALERIEEEAGGFVFVYSPETFNVNRRVYFRLKEKSVKRILELIFEDQGLEFQELDDRIYIKKKRPKGTEISKTTEVKESSQIPENQQSKADQPKALKPQSTPKKAERTKTVREEAKETSTITESEPVAAQGGNYIESLSSYSKDDAQLEIKTREPIPELIFSENRFFKYPISAELVTTLVDFPAMPRMDSVVYVPPTMKQTSKRPKMKKNKKEEEEDKRFRFYGSSKTAYTPLDDRSGIQMGGSVMWLKSKSIGLGVSGYAIQNSPKMDQVLSANYRIAGGYGGIKMEYIAFPDKMIHVRFPLMLGGGEMRYAQKFDISNIGTFDPVAEDSQLVFVAEPGFGVEVNILKFMKVSLDGTYRFVSNSNLNYQQSGDPILSTGTLNGWTGGITVKFGRF